MTDAEFKKSFNAAYAEAVHIIQAQNPNFKKIEGIELKVVYEQFEIFYDMAKRSIDPNGQKVITLSHHLKGHIVRGRSFLQNYADTRVSYQKSIHFLGGSFGCLIGAVQFGFKITNPDVIKYKNTFLEYAKEMVSILKTINPNLKLEHVPKRILEIYHSNSKEFHNFIPEFAQELSR